MKFSFGYQDMYIDIKFTKKSTENWNKMSFCGFFIYQLPCNAVLVLFLVFFKLYKRFFCLNFLQKVRNFVLWLLLWLHWVNVSFFHITLLELSACQLHIFSLQLWCFFILLQEETVEDKGTVGTDPLSVSLYEMDIDRTLFLLRSYLRIRIQKVTSHMLFALLWKQWDYYGC